MKILSTVVAVLIVSSFASYAQSPGGVSGSGTNEVWLDASQLSLNNNDLVTTWADKSGNGFNATQSTGARKPIFKTAQFNGLPAIQFDGVNDRLVTPSIAALNTNTITSFSVFSSSATSTGLVYRYAWTTGATTNSQYIYGQYYEPGTSTFNYLSKNSSGTNQIVTKAGYSGATNVSTQIWNGSSSIEGRMDGTSVGTNTGGTAVPGGNYGISIGANYFSNNGYLKFKIAEKIAYSKVLSSAEINIVENYLAAKYGIAIGNDIYAFDGTAGFDVIGLGKESDGSNLSAQGLSPFGMSIGSMSNGDYIIAGHDNAGYNPDTTDVPLSGYARYDQVWRADVQGAPGTVTVTMDVTTYGLGATNTYKLLVDADGVFAAGATEYAGVYAAGIVTFTGVTLTDNSFFTLANSNSIIKSTGTTTDWHTTTTWDCGCVPVAGMTVIILPTHTVDINGQNAAVANLTVNGTLTFSGSDTLSVLGSLTNNGTFTSGFGTVNLNGSSAQTLAGTLALYNLTIDNAAGATNTGTMSIGSGGFLDVVNGSLATGNALTLISAPTTGTGAFANPATGTISGSYTVQRYLNERWSGGTFGNSWFLLAPAVVGADLEDWNQEFEMQGFPGTEWFPTTSSVYYYDQNNNVTDFNDGYTVPGNTADIIDNQMGHEIFVGDDSYATGPRTIDITGTAALGSIAIPAPHIANIGDPASDGWTLMANPYASPVLYGNIAKSGAYDNAYRRKWDATDILMLDNYVLAVGEAFWVHADPGGATLTFDPSDVNATNVDQYNAKMATNMTQMPMLNIRLTYGENGYDETELGFSENAVDARERGVDAYKLKNVISQNPKIATMIGNTDFCRNILNMNTTSVVPIRVYTQSPSEVLNNYTLEINNVSDILQHNKKLVLEDRELNTFTTLTENISVPFDMMDTVTAARFFLHIQSPLSLTHNDVTCKGGNNGSITVQSDETGVLSYTWMDEDNNIIKQSSNSSGTDKIENLVGGTYYVQVSGKGKESITSKIEILEPSAISADFEINFGDVNSPTANTNGVLEAVVGQEVSFNNLSEEDGSYEWDFGDLNVSNRVNDKHVYFKEGTYAVTLKGRSGNCEVVSTQNLKILPNNNFDSNLLNDIDVIVDENGVLVSLNNTFSEDVNFSIFNSLGQQVFSRDVKVQINHRERINLDNAQGVYLVSVRDSKSTKTKKIVLGKK